MKIWIVEFNNYDDHITEKICLTEEIAKRELEIARNNEPIKNWEKCWNYFGYEVITE